MQRRSSINSVQISTMPRQQTEAQIHLDRYQRAIEKKRLQKELETLEFRQNQIKERLAQLQEKTVTFENTQSHQSVQTLNSDSYQTFSLDF